MPAHDHQHRESRGAPGGVRGGARTRAAGEHRLIRLQRTAGNAAVAGLMIMRHPVAGTLVHRHTAADLFGAPGTTLADFVSSLSVQADWFAEPSLTAADRADLHGLLVRTQEGPHILAGVGDLLLTDLRAVGADWTALAEYGRGRRNSGETVRLIDPAPRPLADRIALGNTLIALKAVIPPATLGSSVSEAQLLDVQASALVPALAAYFTTFQPNLEMTYEPAAGARPLEFQNMLDLLRGPGTAPFATLLGKVRDLHRFPPAMLTNLVHNFADHSRSRPVHLILQGSHDAAGAFQESVHLFADLVADARSLHLMLEGRDTIADLTAAVPGIAAAYGKPDAAGTPRIGQVMIAGHGESKSVDLAQNDEMNVDPDPANAKQKKDTEDLINALMSNMDPSTAKVVYAGCLVGSNPVDAGLPAAGISAHLATSRSLATVTDQAAVAHGIAPGRTQGARASVALGASSSLMDAAGNMAVQYNFDPNAYGDALTYVATGHEPEGVFRAAVEVAATAGPPVAEAQLRARQALGVTAGHEWFDEIIVAAIAVALDGVAPGSGVPAEKLNMLAHMVGPPFLVGNSEDGHGRTVGTLVTDVNSQPLAGDLYARIGGQPSFLAPGNAAFSNGRFVIEQAWLNQGGPREVPLVAFLDATPTATVGWMGSRLDVAAIGAFSAGLFGGAATSGRIRLALAWLRADPANADMKAFLTGQVVRPATGPELTPAVTAELDGASPNEVLTDLGVIATAPAAPGGPALPAANAQVRAGHGNEVRIEPQPYLATVIPAGLNVRRLPGMHGSPFEVVHAGDVLQITGFTHDWAAVDRNGRLGFVLRTKVTPP